MQLQQSSIIFRSKVLLKGHSHKWPLARYFSNLDPMHQPRERAPAPSAGPANPVKPFLPSADIFPQKYIPTSQLTIPLNPARMKG